MRGNPLIYFDTAATSQKPQVVIDALCDFYAHHYATVHRAIYESSLHATQLYDKTRKKAAEYLNATDEEIIFVKGTTEGINLVAFSYGELLKPGDEILITVMEHHSNIVPWQLLCDRKNLTLKVLPINGNAELELDKLDQLLTEKTKLVSVAHMANSTGTINPIEKIIEKAHAAGAVVLIDGAQSAAHMAVDVKKLDCDFYTFSSHKMYGPNGLGILYGKKELLEQMPPYQGGGDMIEKVSFAKTTFLPPPLKFEAGTTQIAEIIAFEKALDYILNLGRENIFDYETTLLDHATDQMKKLDKITIIGTAKHKGPVISFVAKGMHALDLGTMLDLEGIAIRTGHHCAQPTLDFFNVPALARVSFGIYNTKEEVDQFIEVLKTLI